MVILPAGTGTLPTESLTYTGSSLPNGTAAVAYLQSIATATGAASDTTVTYMLYGGSLPGGLSLAATTGVISGIPNAVGTFTFGVLAHSPHIILGKIYLKEP
jgi:hypothetical protein